MSIPRPARGEGFLLVDALRRRGALAVRETGGRVAAVFLPPDDLSDFLSELSLTVRSSLSMPEPELDWALCGSEAWMDLWDAELRPVRVTERIRIVPATGTAHDDPTPPPTPAVDPAGAIEIRLLPGLAFGTTGHPTTLSCLVCLEELVRGGERVADIGTGSGILAIAAARLGAAQVLAIDSDAGACGVAGRNAEANRVADRIRIRHETARPATPIGEEAPFDGVIANLEGPVLLPLVPRLRENTRPGGWLLLSGISSAERPRLARATRAFHLVREIERDGWWTLALRAGPSATDPSHGPVRGGAPP